MPRLEVLWPASPGTSSQTGSKRCGPEMFWPILRETSSELCAPRRLDLRCSDPFRLGRPHNSGFQNAILEVLRPVSRETSSELRAPRCPDLGCSGPIRLGHPHNSGLQYAFLEVLGDIIPTLATSLYWIGGVACALATSLGTPGSDIP